MDKVLFSKFSKDRQKKFQIATLVAERESEKIIVKEAVHQESIGHLAKMAASCEKLKGVYTYPSLSICPCRADGSRVIFPFIHGISLENQIRIHADREEFDKIVEDYQMLWDIISTSAGMGFFKTSERFEDIFGELSLDRELHASEISNIDMIPSNILLNEAGCTVIDYEWVFDFQIPIEYIYARSIFLQEAVSGLGREQQRILYEIGKIDMEEIPAYYQMEVRFQEYVAGKGEKYALSHLYKKMHEKVYPIGLWDYKQQSFALKVEGKKDNVWNEIFYRSYCMNDIYESVVIENTDQYTQFRICPVDNKCLIKIREIAGVRGETAEKLEYRDNHELLIIDDYYYLQPPKLVVDNHGYEKLKLQYLVYRHGDDILDQLVEIIKRDGESRDKNMYLEARINQMENQKVYKMYRKVRDIIKRGN